jgi:membrane-associated phospholipid phosphatase
LPTSRLLTPAGPPSPTAAWLARWWLPLTGAAALLIPLAATCDAPLTAWCAQYTPRGAPLRKALNVAAYLWPWWLLVVLGAGLLLTRQRGRVLPAYAVTVAVCMGLLHLLKFIVGRARPEAGIGPWHFTLGGDPNAGFDAFPSGHTTHGLLLALLLGCYVPRALYVALPLALALGASRIVVQYHWLSDVVGGVWLVLLVTGLAVRIMPGAFPALVGPRPAPPEALEKPPDPRVQQAGDQPDRREAAAAGEGGAAISR